MRRIGRTTFGLVAMVSLFFALATLAVGGIVYEVTHEALEQQLDHRTAIETQTLLGEAGHGGLRALAAAIRRREAARSGSSLFYILVDRDGRRVAGSLAAAVPGKTGYEEFLHYDGGGRVAQALTTRLADGSRLVVAADREVIDEIDLTILKLFAAALAVMLTLGVGAAGTVAAVTRARLRRLDQAALAIIDGDMSRRMPRDGSDSEFDRLAATLNRMLDRIEGLFDNLRQVSSDVAHDLRTPLTRLHHRLEEAMAADTMAARSEGIQAALDQTQDLLEIFAALLRISEVEALGVRERFETLTLGEIVEDAIDTYRPDADNSGHNLESAVEPGLQIVGDRRLLRQLLANLLDNALRHTPAGTTISVTLSADEESAALAVADDGPGVDPADLPRLFQRFSRSEQSRSSEGHGLGLALVAAIAAAHAGRAEAATERGFRVTVSLPRAI